VDLSLWPVGSKKEAPSDHSSGGSFSAVIEAGQKLIISDDSAVLGSYAESIGKSRTRFDIIVDNAGFELFCDLCLADYLSTSGMASEVHVHLKAHPTFVSDAMAKDVGDTVEYLCRAEEPGELRVLGTRWADHIESGRWLLREDFFWVQPQPMWEMPKPLAADLSLSSLVFVKGDANYRRLLGDCAWPYDTPFGDILSYFPAPVCALRTLKAELGCGMPRSKTDRISSKDPKWLVSGRYGVVQFLNPRV
jgi:Damage-control phosphatase ARMT1-like domain